MFQLSKTQTNLNLKKKKGKSRMMDLVTPKKSYCDNKKFINIKKALHYNRLT